MPFRPFFDTPEQRQERLARGLISSQARQNALRNAAAELTIRRTASPSGIPKLESMERTPGVDTAALVRNRQAFEERQVVDKYIRDYAAGGPVQPFAYQSYPEYKAFVDRQLSNQVPSPTLTQVPLTGPPQPEVQPTAAEEQAINRAGFQYGQRGILTGGEVEQLTPIESGGYLLPRSLEGRLGVNIPGTNLRASLGTLARRLSYTGPETLFAAPLLGPAALGGRAVEGVAAPTGRQILGTAAAGIAPGLGLTAAQGAQAGAAGAERIAKNLSTATEEAGGFGRLLAGETGRVPLPQPEPRFNVPVLQDTAFRELVGGRGLTPPPSRLERGLNALRRVVGGEVPEGVSASRVMQERKELTQTVESLSNRLGALAEKEVVRTFAPDKQGRIQSLPGAPTIQDVAARLPEYEAQLTPEQVSVLNSLREEVGYYQRALEEVGVETGTRPDIMEGGFYLPRGRADLEGADNPIKVGVGGGKRGVRRGFERQAQFESMAQGINAGYRYAPFGEAIQSFAKDAGQRALEQHATNVFKAAEVEGEPLGQTLKARIAQAKTRGLTGKAAVTAGERLPRGQSTIGFYGLQGISFPDAVANAANRYLQAEGPTRGNLAGIVNATSALNNLLRGTRATADASFMGIQGALGAVDQPRAYAAAMKVAAKSLNDRLVLGQKIAEFDAAAAAEGLPTSREWLRAGLRMGGADTEFQIGGRAPGLPGVVREISETTGRAPVIRQANRAFGYFGDTLRLEAANDIARARGATGQALEDIANHVNLMTGWSRGRFLGDAGSLVEFAPRFFQSQLELLANALTKGGIEGQQARQALIKLMGVGTLLTVAANEAQGNKGFDYLSPFKNGQLNSNFMRIRFKGQDISLFGPWDSLLRGIVATGTGHPEYLARTKASPIVSTAIDAITGRTFTGEKFTPESFLRSLLPFSISQIGKESLLGTAIGTTGLKATPETAYEKLAARFEEIKGRPFNPEVDFTEAEQTPELRSLVEDARQSALQKGSTGAESAQVNQQARAKLETDRGLPDIATQFANGTPDQQLQLGPELMQRYRDYKSQVGGIFALSDVLRGEDRQPNSQAGKDLQSWRDINPYTSKYQDPQTGQVDWDSYDTDKQAAFSKLPQYTQDAINAQLHSQTPELLSVEPQLEKALDLHKQLFDIPAHKGTTKEDESNLRRVEAQVDRHLDELARQGIDTAKLSDHVRQGVYILAAKDVGLDRTFGVAAYVLRPGSKMDEKLRNLDYDQFLIDHESELRPFFPNLYSRKVLREAAQIGR